MFVVLSRVYAKLFPAWAGVIPSQSYDSHQAYAFPRMGGGDPQYPRERRAALFFSPHGRG